MFQDPIEDLKNELRKMGIHTSGDLVDRYLAMERTRVARTKETKDLTISAIYPEALSFLIDKSPAINWSENPRNILMKVFEYGDPHVAEREAQIIAQLTRK